MRINTVLDLSVFQREAHAELYHSTVEPQDYEMVEFFLKRLKLWMGLSKAKEVNSAF